MKEMVDKYFSVIYNVMYDIGQDLERVDFDNANRHFERLREVMYKFQTELREQIITQEKK